MAAHWLIPISKLKSIGGFSPAFPHYGEDVNLVQRAKFFGYKIGIVPETIGVHDRENRPTPPEKKKYINYMHTVAILNDPNCKHVTIAFIKKIIGHLIHPSSYNLRYFGKSISSYISSKKFKKISLTQGAFLS